MATLSAIPEAQRRAALESVVSSKTFDRSEQLKAFLRYVCEREFKGSGESLTEYLIGVHALGRPSTFSPIEDSIVRNRAYALRKKLDEFYQAEGAGERIRIELPKGSYAPQFVTAVEPPVVVPEVPQPPALPRRIGLPWWAAALALFVGAGLVHLWERDRLIPRPPQALQQLWGSLVDPREEVILCVSTPASIFLRNYPVENPPVRGTYPVDETIRAWVRKQRPEDAAEIPYMVPNLNSPLWGDAAGATRVARTLATYGVRSDQTAERLLKLPALRNRSVVFLGSTEYSIGVRRLLSGLPFQLIYDIVVRDHIGVEMDSASKVTKRFAVERNGDALSTTWGLLSFLPGEGDGQVRRRYLVISGVSSAGTLAAAEYATSESHLAELLRKTGGATGGPRGILQVLIRVKVDQTLPLHFEYADHRLR